MSENKQKKEIKNPITREAFLSCSSCPEKNNIILMHTTREWKVNSVLMVQGSHFFTFQYFKSREY